MNQADVIPVKGKKTRRRGPGIHLVAKGNFDGTEALWELTALLKKAKKRTRGMKTHIWRPIGEKIILKRVKQRFRSGGLADGDPVSARWQKLSDVTVMIRREEKLKGKQDRGGGQPIKRKTLKLQTHTRFWMGQGKNVVRVGAFLGYAPFQEFGGYIKPQIEKAGSPTNMSEDAEKQYYYITGRDDRGKRVRIRIPQATTAVPARPAVYMNKQMVQEATDVVAEYVRTRFEDGPPTVERIMRTAIELKGVPF